MPIAIDLMGSDTPPEILYEGVLNACRQDSLNCLVILTPDVAKKLAPHPLVNCVFCSDVIAMEDKPLEAVRRKKNSSIAVGLQLVKEKKAEALISAGNTGALMAASTFILSLKPDVERLALIAHLPRKKGSLVVLDVGAHPDADAKQLEQLALLGFDYLRTKKEKIKLGILNIGIECLKGDAAVREAHQLIEKRFKDDLQVLFVGNVEARQPFHDDIDLLVTDGFTGNIFLKTAEGSAMMVLENLKEEGVDVPFSLENRYNYQALPGAVLYGVQGTVIKCHGNATAEHLYRSIRFYFA